ncbi:MAG: serpin family protein [Lachnospiraceae bacterium]|nr:serpin family protein [Lachnospiraceae bacterium]
MRADDFMDDIVGGAEEKWVREAGNIDGNEIRKKRRIRMWSRAAAAAACLGLIIFAVSRLPFGRQSADNGSGAVGRETSGGPESTAQDSVIPKAQAADLLENYTANPVEKKEPDDAFIRAGYDWAVRLFQETWRQETEQKTLLVSPLSVATALAMTANGARGNTLREMEQVLGGGSLTLSDLNAYLHTYLKSLPSSERAKCVFADGIWFNDRGGFTAEEPFLQRNADYFDAAIRKAPFNGDTVREINQWAEQHTDGMIPELLKELDDSGRMVLVNALAFDAEWREPFEEHGENRQPFTNLDGSTVRTPTMGGETYFYLEDDSCIGFEKPYAVDTYRFVALLPKDETDFEGFIAGLSGEKLAALREAAMVEKTVIALPKFSYDYTVELPAVLKTMGMRDAFDAARADLSGISRSEPLYISKVLHKTHIDLDSAGTRAAAVTAVTVNFGAMPDYRVVILNRPFVYMIVDTAAGLPVFIGTVTGFSE